MCIRDSRLRDHQILDHGLWRAVISIPLQRRAGQADHSIDPQTSLLQCFLCCQRGRASGQDVVHQPERPVSRRLLEQTETPLGITETSASVQPVLACSDEAPFQEIG